ncbi:MAG: isochorismatase family cysteine hydrolase [Flavobacteriaceae bacterium]
MKAIIIIDAQNEFSKNGKRPVPNFIDVIKEIFKRVEFARENNTPIAWVRHFNQPNESSAYIPGTWGSEFYTGLGPLKDKKLEREFHKNVYGAFTGSNIGQWLNSLHITEVIIMGFYTHGCVSTTAREAIMAGFNVSLPINTTGACNIEHELLGEITANEVRRSSLLHLANMGAEIL